MGEGILGKGTRPVRGGRAKRTLLIFQENILELTQVSSRLHRAMSLQVPLVCFLCAIFISFSYTNSISTILSHLYLFCGKSMSMEVRGQAVRQFGSLLLPCGSRDSNSGLQAWYEAPHLTELTYQPSIQMCLQVNQHKSTICYQYSCHLTDGTPKDTVSQNQVLSRMFLSRMTAKRYYKQDRGRRYGCEGQLFFGFVLNWVWVLLCFTFTVMH